MSAGAGGSPDECPDDSSYGFGGSAQLREDENDYTSPARAFGWTPLTADLSARLFLVLRDEEGGQTWQEIRTE